MKKLLIIGASILQLPAIKKAKELILLGNDSIKAISIKVGFSGDSQFIRAYKRIEGVTPGNFRSANSPIQSSGGNE